jgi:hypothetical protein
MPAQQHSGKGAKGFQNEARLAGRLAAMVIAGVLFDEARRYRSRQKLSVPVQEAVKVWFELSKCK